MTDLSRFELERLWEDGESALWRGTSAGEAPLLVLVPGSTQPAATVLGRLQRACSLRGELDPAWAVRPIDVVYHRGGPTLVSEDPGAEVLARHLGRPWSIGAFLPVAIGVTAALRQLHARGLIHKDIKPAHILVDLTTSAVWLTGFGIASRLPRERQPPEPADVLEGTLSHMAPEQTGRMNRSIDSRSDLYALGVVFYELLTGAPPFAAVDPMEWVHCHIARVPSPLQSRDKAIPQPICDVVMKLLAKTPEERYQTAAGLEHDLRRALDAWTATGCVRLFALGEHDASDRLLIPEKLYGRDAEVGVLLSSLGRVVASGDAELVLVSGYSGIGKSSIVNELHRVLVAPRGLFASGKFDQYKRDIPYATLVQAFQVLIRHILGKSDEEIAGWREQLTQALGGHGQLITNLVPELELVIGKQPSVPEIPPKDAQARFQLVVRRYLSVFARADHPLALFLDDLQWLDSATLELLEHLLSEREVRHLLLIGAYRDNEVGPKHPLAATLARLRQSSRVKEIVLAPLQSGDIAAMCAHALHASPTAVAPLAELVHEKTGGNPFFAIQFIGTLVEEHLLAFEPAAASWQWDIDAIRAKGFTDNVVDLMTRRLDRFRAETRNALQQLACLGNSALTATLSLVYGAPEDAIHDALREVIQSGLVVRTATGFAFLHDRVQEAAYAMIAETERAAEHLRIGNLLAENTSAEDLDENIFEIVNHLNRGAALIDSPEARDRVAALNRIAGQRAKASTANMAAHGYIAFGRSLLGPDSWERNFRLTFDLELHLADSEFVIGALDEAEERLSRLSARAETLTDRAAVIFVQTNLYTAMAGRIGHAVEICLGYLRHVGIDWSAHPSKELVQAEYEKLVARIGGRSIDDLLKLPLSNDPELHATIEVLMGAMTPAFMTDFRLVSLILCRMGNLGLEHGNNDTLSLGYAFLGMTLGCHFGDYRTGYLFGKLALDLVEVRGLTRYRGRVYHTLGTHVLYWTQPLPAAKSSLRRGLQAMKEIGDVTYVGFGYIGLAAILLGCGDSLELVQCEVEAGLATAQQVKFELALDAFAGYLRLVRALRGQLSDPCTLDDCGHHFAGLHMRCWYWIRTMQACVIVGDFETARAAARLAEPLLPTTTVFFEVIEYHFYAALVCATFADTGELAEHRRHLAIWAETCPENYENRLALVDAEIARLEGRSVEAMEAYERAIRSARENGFVHNEAVAYEVAARFYRGRGFDTFAHAYVAKAHDCYRRWGADGKVALLERDHPWLRKAPTLETIDLAMVVKTSQAVALQVGVERIIDSLMVIVLQHAGADRGLLVLRRPNGLCIEADARTERDGVTVSLPHKVVDGSELAESVLQYAVRTQEPVLIDDAQAQHPFSSDPYLTRHGSRSVLCLPIVKQTEVIGALYLENNLAPYVFTPTRTEVLKFLASQAAISLENASLEEKEALLNEVHHRVKNNLQLISSLLNLQAARTTDPAVAELFAESRNRVRSMALVHENLYRAGNFSKIPMAGHIKSLCTHLTRAYGAPDLSVEIVVGVDDVHLDMSRAISVGLIVNELVSNALKHAFAPAQKGRIHVDLASVGPGRYVLCVGDDGVGLPPSFDLERADSLGLQLVRSLAQQLNGTLGVNRHSGTAFTIAFDDPWSTRAS
jgi:predicted ATPase/two-component sensor histidine kinase